MKQNFPGGCAPWTPAFNREKLFFFNKSNWCAVPPYEISLANHCVSWAPLKRGSQFLFPRKPKGNPKDHFWSPWGALGIYLIQGLTGQSDP